MKVESQATSSLAAASVNCCVVAGVTVSPCTLLLQLPAGLCCLRGPGRVVATPTARAAPQGSCSPAAAPVRVQPWWMMMACRRWLVPPVQGLLLCILALHIHLQDSLAPAEHNTVANSTVVAAKNTLLVPAATKNTLVTTKNASLVATAVKNTTKDATVVAATKDATVVATKDATVVATKDAAVVATKNAREVAAKNATVMAATKDATVVATKNATVVATKNATVVATKNAREVAAKNATVVAATKDAAVVATKNAREVATKDAAVVAAKDAAVVAARNAREVAAKNATVGAATKDALEVAAKSASVVTTASHTLVVATNTSVVATGNASVATNTSVDGAQETVLTCQSFQCSGERCYQDEAHSNRTVTCHNETYCELYRFSSTNYTARCSSRCGVGLCRTNSSESRQQCALECCATTLCLQLNASAYGDLPPTTAPPTTATTTHRPPSQNGKVCTAFSCHGDGCFKGRKTITRCILGQDFCEMKKTGSNYMAGCSKTCKAAKPVCASGMKAACYQECCPAIPKASCLKLDGKIHVNSAEQVILAPLLKVMACGVVLLLNYRAFTSLWG
ncbi:uncharacterized protein LOC114058871 [Empidonax traillii]|uniref:uncharacterized protein LOC114058871 n=1 Tax=Empidonax traillii TaxID=164674 RepID=UPI000FFD53F2|nr:uncharacterized protein LOC114058871 [Empidonax traillii]